MNEQFVVKFNDKQRRQLLDSIDVGEAWRSPLWHSLLNNGFKTTVFDRKQAREIYSLCMKLRMRVIDIAGLNYTKGVIVVRCVKGVGILAGGDTEVEMKHGGAHGEYEGDHYAEYQGDYRHIFDGLVIGEHEFAIRWATPFNSWDDDADIFVQIIGYKKAS